MADTEAALAKEVLGSMIADDGETILTGFKNGDVEFAVAMDAERALNAITALLHGLYEVQKLDGSAQDKSLGRSRAQMSLTPDWYELGISEDGQVVLTLRIQNGPKIAFVLPGEMPKSILETLQVVVSGNYGNDTPDIPLN